MIVEDEEAIDPNSWTTKELVKHLYREIKQLQQNQEENASKVEDIKSNLADIRAEIAKENLLRLERDRAKDEELERHKIRMKAYIAAASIIGGLVTTFVGFLLGL